MSAVLSSLRLDQVLTAARYSPPLELLEWDGEDTADAKTDEGSRQNLLVTFDSRRLRIRERYIGARFAGLIRTSRELRAVETVVKSARLLFEEGQSDAAFELLELATQEEDAEELRLAGIEIAFLLHDAGRFTESVRAHRAAYPMSAIADEIARLGRALLPGEPLFGAASAAETDDHYGPWPHLPNWIRAPWDLTGECAAADLHRALQGEP